MSDRSGLLQSNSTNSPDQFGSRPNMKNYNVATIKNLLSTAKSAMIVVPQLSIDTIAASLALALSLKKKGITAKVYCPQKTDQNYSKLAGLDLLTEVYNDNNLTITLQYPLDQIDQVSYNDDNQRLNLVVKTKPNAPKIENDKITINNQSSSTDVAFMLGDETSLGENSTMVNKGNWVFISPINTSKSWAKATLIDQDAPFCEIFAFLLPMLGLQMDVDSAKNLLIGLRVSTQSFSVNVSPETFEAGARCLKATQTANQTNQANKPAPVATNQPQSQPQSTQPAQPSQPVQPVQSQPVPQTPSTTPLSSVETSPVSKFQPNKGNPLPTA